MHNRDAEGALKHLDEEVVLWSPIFPDPFEGKKRAGPVLGVVLDLIKTFDVVEVIHGSAQTVVVFRFTAGDESLEGVDLITLASDGKIASLKLMWRPLPGIIAMQNLIAPRIGAPAMVLVPKESV